MVGNSLGSTLIMKHVIDKKVKNLLPEKIILLQAVYVSTPLQRFIDLAKYPLRFRMIMRLVRFFFPLLMLKQRRKNRQFYDRSKERIRSVNIEKMRVGLLNSVTLNIIDDLPKVDVPALVMGHDTDVYHPKEQAQTITNRIKNGKYLDMIDDNTLHSDKTAEVIVNFIREKSN